MNTKYPTKYPEPKRNKIKNYHKYLGDYNNIWYRSSWELKFLHWCDTNPGIIKFSSEEIVVPYLSPKDNKIHRYFVDALIKTKDITGNINTYLIEIKPYCQTIPPKERRKTQTYLNEVMLWGINNAKWEAAKKMCDIKGWQFKIITEKELGLK